MTISKEELHEVIKEYIKGSLKVSVYRDYYQGDNILVVNLYFQDGDDQEPIFTSDYDIY